MLNLAFPLSILVRINEISSVYTLALNPVYATFMIPLKENSTDIVYYANNADSEQFLRIETPTMNFRVDVRYLDGTLCSLNGADFELYMEKVC
jgi:hypothetical protein